MLTLCQPSLSCDYTFTSVSGICHQRCSSIPSPPSTHLVTLSHLMISFSLFLFLLSLPPCSCPLCLPLLPFFFSLATSESPDKFVCFSMGGTSSKQSKECTSSQEHEGVKLSLTDANRVQSETKEVNNIKPVLAGLSMTFYVFCFYPRTWLIISYICIQPYICRLKRIFALRSTRFFSTFCSACLKIINNELNIVHFNL